MCPIRAVHYTVLFSEHGPVIGHCANHHLQTEVSQVWYEKGPSLWVKQWVIKAGLVLCQ